MEENTSKPWPRQPNQHPIREPHELSEKSKELLSLMERYQHTWNVTNFQYACLLGISRRHTIKHVNELLEKGYIEIWPKTRKRGRGTSNTYRVIKKLSD
jgi:hypothetical protein